jgi:hypothetical protein
LTFHPTMKRRLHERLHPLIGEEEADALLDEISPPDPITREWLEERFDLIAGQFALVAERFDRVDERFELIDERFDRVDERFELIDERFDRVDERFDRVDERFDRVDERFDLVITKADLDQRLERFVTREHFDTRLEQADIKMTGESHRITGEMYQALTQQTHRVYGAAGLFALIISIVDRIWG